MSNKDVRVFEKGDRVLVAYVPKHDDFLLGRVGTILSCYSEMCDVSMGPGEPGMGFETDELVLISRKVRTL